MSIMEVLESYTTGELTETEANNTLFGLDAPYHLDAGRNAISEAEKRQTWIGCFPEMARGWGLLDTGTGTLDKVQVEDGKLVNMDCGEMYALLVICGHTYHVHGNVLTE